MLYLDIFSERTSNPREEYELTLEKQEMALLGCSTKKMRRKSFKIELRKIY